MNNKALEKLGIEIPPSAEILIKEMRNSVNIVGLSGGKDSTATCILMHLLDIPFKTVTAEVMWKKDIPGEHPYHYEWFHGTLLPQLEKWGIETEVIHSKITAYEYMTTPIKASSKHPERNGKLRGFPLCGSCGIQRDCKARPCERYYKYHPKPYNVITGIAGDEDARLVSNTLNNRKSLLEALKLREYMTFPICGSFKLISPIYSFSNRNGCWFCPNQKIQEFEVLYREFPQLWRELMDIQEMPNKVTELFTRTQTLYDIEKQIKAGVQMKIFTGDFFR
jgi:hypothetical protein